MFPRRTNLRLRRHHVLSHRWANGGSPTLGAPPETSPFHIVQLHLEMSDFLSFHLSIIISSSRISLNSSTGAFNLYAVVLKVISASFNLGGSNYLHRGPRASG